MTPHGGLRTACALLAVVALDGAVLAGLAAPASADDPGSGSVATTLLVLRETGHKGYGESVTLAGLLVRSDTNTPLSSEPLVLERQLAGEETFAPVAEETTAEDGSVVFSTAAVRNASYRVSFAGAADEVDPSVSYDAVASRRMHLKVARMLTAVGKQLAYRNFRFHGRVTPNYVDRPVLLQRRVGSAWRTISRQHTTAKGRWSFRVLARAKPGLVVYRTVAQADSMFMRGRSPEFHITTT